MEFHTVNMADHKTGKSERVKVIFQDDIIFAPPEVDGGEGGHHSTRVYPLVLQTSGVAG